MACTSRGGFVVYSKPSSYCIYHNHSKVLNTYLISHIFILYDISFFYSSNFWKQGAFDIQWLGKAYFLGMSVIFVFATWYFELFTAQKMSGSALSLLIKFFGILFVEQSTPNLELSIVLLLPLLFYDNLEYFFYRASIQYEAMAQIPTTKLTGKRLNATQFDEVCYYYIHSIMSIPPFIGL